MRFPTKYDSKYHGHEWLDVIALKKSKGFHPGVDFNYGYGADDEGQEVVAISDGIIKHARFCGGWGNHVIIYHPEYKIYSHYAHLKNINIKEEEEVKEGFTIGLLGKTGGDWSPHLHFEIRLNDIRPDKYVTGMTREDVKMNYANPEKWIKEKIQEKKQSSEMVIDKNTNNMKIFKNSNSAKIYFVGQDNKKHWIKDEKTLLVGKKVGFWSNWSDDKVIDDDPYAEGDSVLFIPKK